MIKIELQKDFNEKANSFANWFTSVVIANFVYLIDLKGEAILHECISKVDYILTVAALAIMFLFKILGVITSWLRVIIKDKKDAPPLQQTEKVLEFIRAWLLFPVFIIFGCFAAIISSWILYRLNFYTK